MAEGKNIGIAFRSEGKKIGIGHLKFLISDRNQHIKLSVVSLQDEVEKIKIDGNWKSPFTFAVNARLECSAEQILNMFKIIFFEQLIKEKIRIEVLSEQSFQPGFPTPTHHYPE